MGLVARPGFTRGQLFLSISTFKPSLNNYEPNDIFLFKSVEPFSSFSETNEQHLIFVYKKIIHDYNMDDWVSILPILS